MEKEITSEEELVAYCRTKTNGAEKWRDAAAELAHSNKFSFVVTKNDPAIAENDVSVCSLGLPLIGLPEICILLGPKKKESSFMDSDGCEKAINGAEDYLLNVAAGICKPPEDCDVITIEGEGEFFVVDPDLMIPTLHGYTNESNFKMLTRVFKNTVAGLGHISFQRRFVVRALKDIETKNTLN